jgi:ferrochelatase
MSKAIVLLNMGGPNNLDEVELFLKNMFNDENILPIKNPFIRRGVASLITALRKKEAKSNYERLGGSSPLNLYTDELIKKLSKKLKDVYITKAMRYTPPFAKEVIADLKSRSIKEVFLIPLYPHYSTTTTKSSLEDFYNRAKEMEFSPKFYEVKNFYKDEKFNEAIIERIDEALKDRDSKEYDLIFSAHSLPKTIVEKGDPYLKEVKEHIELLSKKLNGRFNKIHLAFQSKLGPVKWLEPSLEDKLSTIENKKVLIYPISFILDNSETEFELHIEYKEVAKNLGYEDYKVARCVNDSEKFIDALAQIYEKMG